MTKNMDIAKFPSVAAFLEWIGRPGVEIDGTGKGWEVKIDDQGVVSTSPFYSAHEGKGPYFPWKIFGHLIAGLGVESSGVIEFGFAEDGGFKKLNRRRVLTGDVLKDGQVVVAVTNDAAPDRLEEPIAVLAVESDREKIRALSPELRLKLYDAMRDGVEMEALRRVWRWADQD